VLLEIVEKSNSTNESSKKSENLKVEETLPVTEVKVVGVIEYFIKSKYLFVCFVLTLRRKQAQINHQNHVWPPNFYQRITKDHFKRLMETVINLR
jgi:hypothetical protein